MSASRRSELPCQAARAAIDAMLEGALVADAAKRLEAHLATCPACAQQVARERRYRDAMVRFGRAESAPDSLRARVAVLLDEDRAPGEAASAVTAGRH